MKKKQSRTEEYYRFMKMQINSSIKAKKQKEKFMKDIREISAM